MRRIVWSSLPAPTTFTDPRNGRRFSGKYHVEVVLFEVGERLTALQDGRQIPLTRKVAAYRADAGPGAAIRVPPVPERLPDVPPADIPDAVFAALPQDADVIVQWKFRPEAAL